MKNYKVRLNFVVSVLAMLLVVASCKDAEGNKTKAATTVNAPTEVSYSANDREVVGLMLSIQKIDHIYEEVAKAKASTPELKEALGQVLHNSEHIKIQTEAVLKKLTIEEKGSSAKKSLLRGMHRYLKPLKEKTGLDFDKAYLKNQLRFDQFCVDIVTNKLLPNTDNNALKALLESFLPIYHRELKHLEKTLTELSN